MDFFVYHAVNLNFSKYALQLAHAPSWGWVGPTVKDRKGIGLKNNLLSYDYVSDEVDSSDGKWVLLRKVKDKTLTL